MRRGVASWLLAGTALGAFLMFVGQRVLPGRYSDAPAFRASTNVALPVLAARVKHLEEKLNGMFNMVPSPSCVPPGGRSYRMHGVLSLPPAARATRML